MVEICRTENNLYCLDPHGARGVCLPHRDPGPAVLPQAWLQGGPPAANTHLRLPPAYVSRVRGRLTQMTIQSLS